MEEYFRFILPAIFFIIYVINQVRKMKKAAEEQGQGEVQPHAQPVKPVVSKPVVQTSKKEFDYKGKREIKERGRRSVFVQKEDKPVVYKPVADEELMAEAVLEHRKAEGRELKQDRKPLADEHLDPYATHSTKKDSINLDWLKDKSNLKKTFIAAEIFQRRY